MSVKNTALVISKHLLQLEIPASFIHINIGILCNLQLCNYGLLICFNFIVTEQTVVDGCWHWRFSINRMVIRLCCRFAQHQFADGERIRSDRFSMITVFKILQYLDIVSWTTKGIRPVKLSPKVLFVVPTVPAAGKETG